MMTIFLSIAKTRANNINALSMHRVIGVSIRERQKQKLTEHYSKSTTPNNNINTDENIVVILV